MSKQSSELSLFYTSYRDWLNAGAPHNEPYNRRWGLCTNLEKFIVLNKFSSKLLEELKTQFKSSGLNPVYPFGSEEVYEDNYQYASQHLNKDRIKWVEDHCYV